MRSGFLVFDDVVINVDDISTVVSYYDRATVEEIPPAGVKVTFMSKATSVQLPGVSVDDFVTRLTALQYEESVSDIRHPGKPVEALMPAGDDEPDS